MDKQVITEVAQMASIEKILGHISDVTTDRPFVALPDSMSIVDLEKYMPRPQRYIKKFKTQRVSEFVRYCKDYEEKTSQCVISADDLSGRVNPKALTIFDNGTPDEPLFRDHFAVIELQKLPEYETALDLNGHSFGQKEFAEWIEEYADNLNCYSKDGEVMSAVSAARAVREMSIAAAREVQSTVDDFSESRSISESVEAKNAGQKPAVLHYTFTPFPGFEERTVEFRISILTGGEKPSFKLRLMRLDRLIQLIADEFTAKVEDGLVESDIPIYLGSA